MDLNRLNKFVDSASKASSISKARSSFINEVKNLKEGYRSQLLEAREPITKLEEKRIQSQKKSDDERQDKLITQLQDNQRAITTELRDIKFDRQALLEELPLRDALDAPRTAAIEHPEYKKPTPAIYDPDEMTPNYDKLFYENKKGDKINFPKPSVVVKMSDKDRSKIIDNVNKAITSWIGKSTSKNQEEEKLAITQKEYFKKYKSVINPSLEGKKTFER